MRDELLPLRIALAVVMVGFIAYLSLEFIFFGPTSFANFWSEIWGRAVLIDLYVVLGLFCAWIVYREKGIGRGIFWTIFILCTGSAGVCFYLLKALHPIRTWTQMDLFFLGHHKETAT
jgi:hypothetical protein